MHKGTFTHFSAPTETFRTIVAKKKKNKNAEISFALEKGESGNFV